MVEHVGKPVQGGKPRKGAFGFGRILAVGVAGISALTLGYIYIQSTLPPSSPPKLAVETMESGKPKAFLEKTFLGGGEDYLVSTLERQGFRWCGDASETRGAYYRYVEDPTEMRVVTWGIGWRADTGGRITFITWSPETDMNSEAPGNWFTRGLRRMNEGSRLSWRGSGFKGRTDSFQCHWVKTWPARTR